MGEPITQEHLEKYIGWKMRVDSNQERIARAKSNETFPPMKEGDGSKHQPGAGDRMVSAILQRMDIEARLLPIIEETLDKMERIEQAVYSLEDPFEQEVLTYRYLDGYIDEDGDYHYKLMPWADVAVKIYGGDEEKHLKATYRLHDRAIESLSKVGEDES